MSKVTGKPVVIVAAPVKINEKVAGVLYARVDLGAFSEEMVDPVRIGRTGYAFLLDKSGMIFSHPDKERILKQNVFEQDWGKRIRDQDKGVVDYGSEKGAATAIFTKNKATGWTVAVVVPGADIAASLKSLRNASLLFSAAGVALVSLIIFLIVRRMINDLAAAVDFAGAVASGDLGKDLTVTRSDEVGRLSDSLTVMVGRLKEMIENSNAKTARPRNRRIWPARPRSRPNRPGARPSGPRPRGCCTPPTSWRGSWRSSHRPRRSSPPRSSSRAGGPRSSPDASWRRPRPWRR
jgi:methyl-accepting chemotaxis protein